MIRRKTAISLLLVTSLALAGCSSLGIFDNKTTAEKIETEMNENVKTVQVNSTTTQVLSITNNNTTINQTQQQQVRARYDYQNNSYIAQGVGSQSVIQRTQNFAFERYFVNGTIYTKQQRQNQSTGWQTQATNLSVETESAPVANASFLEQYNYTQNNSTNESILQYSINLKENPPENTSLIEDRSFSPFDSRLDELDTYVIEIEVHKETHRLKSVKLYIQYDMNNSELAEINPDYAAENMELNEGEEPPRGRLTYATTLEYSQYNEPLNVSLPEEAKNQS